MPSTNSHNDPLSDASFLNQVRGDMLKFAQLQLRDFTLAEDAVQEALIAAYQSRDKYRGQSAYKTWVFAILKNKIIDLLRKSAREVNESALCSGEDELTDVMFNKRGFWHAEERPAGWVSPSDSANNDHFWRVFETCLSQLPENLSRTFMMREFLGLDSDEICSVLNISSSNLHVILYRARIRLRECLQQRWFKEKQK